MNKLVMMMVVGGLALAGCGGGKKSDTTMTGGGDTAGSDMAGSGDATTPPTAEGTPCTQEIALECPAGQIDGCLKTPPEGETHTCVAQ